VEVEYNGGLWKYSGTRYWYPGHEHSFVAVHPAEAVKNSVGLSYADSKLSFVYSLPMAADGVTIDKAAAFDLLAATHRRLYNDGVTTAVTLRFSHLMSLLNLAPAFVDNLMGNDDYILIHRLELSGVNTSARFDILPAQRLSNPQTDDKVVDITPSGESNSVIVLPTPVKINNHQGNVSLFADNDAIIIIPQSFAAGSDASIIFHFSINEETTMRQVALPLSNLNWDSGKSYLYKVTFERSGLVLDKCEINSWNDIKGDEITVD
ncbi:MAG: fimbrillin family protein, partial [Muribaculaceae bacterium]|nr:fimbrillin family protein [Muribaculaceae bacterium]